MLDQLKIATLNFSGINTSPFEYHNGSKEKSHLNSIFQRLLDEYNDGHPGVKWDIGKLDKIFNKERYSVLYRPDCGFVRKRLVTQSEFEAIWDRTFDENQGIVGHMNLKDELIDKLRVFDWMVYKAFVISIFGEIDLQNPLQHSVEKYRQQLKKWHSQAFLNQDKKIDNVREYIIKNQIDIMFLQQALNHRIIDLLPSDQFSYIKNEDSIIIYKKENFFMEEKDQGFHEKYGERLNFNKDSAYLKSKEFLLVCVHLSSKGVNIEQGQNMFEVLNEIQVEYPELIIVVGADANHNPEKAYNFNLYPDNMAPTTRKKRTHMQCQFNKSGKLIEETKDLIISNRLIKNWSIETIKQTEISDQLLPNNDHPYDHFLVCATMPFQRSRYPKFLRQNYSTIQLRFGGSTTFQDNYPMLRANTFQSLLSQIKPPSDNVFIRRRTYGQQNDFQPTQIYKYVSSIELNMSNEKNRRSSFDFHQ